MSSLADFYGPEWAELLAQAVSGLEQAAETARVTAPAAVSDPAMADAFAQSVVSEHVSIDSSALVALLTQLHADAYVVGLHAGTAGGMSLSGSIGSLVANVDWSAWRPGNLPAADLVRGTYGGQGLARLLADAQVTIRGIDGTTLDRLAETLAQGLERGSSVDTIASDLSAVVADPARARMIAVTETARAMTAASMDVYRSHGRDEFDFLAEPDACPVCLALMASNPHPITDMSAWPPRHPRCRCAAAPHV